MLSRWLKNLAKLDSEDVSCQCSTGVEIQAWQGFSIIETTSFRSKIFQTKYFFKRSKLE